MPAQPERRQAPDSAPGGADLSLSARKEWAFRAVAVALPLLFGGLLVVVALVVQGRLVLDEETGWPRLQDAPIYVQEPGSDYTGHRYLYDPLLGWRNIPNWRATTRGKPLSINSHGLRDREYDYAKPSGTSRIFVLGDSFAWGYGVADDETFTEVLEHELRQQRPGWEVLNAGVSGWGTDQEYLYLSSEGFKYSPDVVVLAFLVFNDPENNLSTVQYGLHKPAFRTPALDLIGVPVPVPGSGVAQSTTDADPVELTMAIIGRIAAECAAHGASLLVMQFGMFLPRDDPRPAEWAARFATRLSGRNDLTFLNLDDAFAKRGLTVDALAGGNDNGHWNANGHRVTAEILETFLTSSGLVR